MKKTSCYRNIIILLGVEDHPYCTNCSKILWTTICPFGIEVLFFQYFEHCAQVRISKTIWESTIVYFIISGNASKEIPQKTYFFPILFFIFWQAINNRTSSHNTVLHITIYLGSWYSWYSVVSMHLHRKYVYITVHSKICQKVQFRATKNSWKYWNKLQKFTSFALSTLFCFFRKASLYRDKLRNKSVNISYFGMPWKP